MIFDLNLFNNNRAEAKKFYEKELNNAHNRIEKALKSKKLPIVMENIVLNIKDDSRLYYNILFTIGNISKDSVTIKDKIGDTEYMLIVGDEYINSDNLLFMKFILENIIMIETY